MGISYEGAFDFTKLRDGVRSAVPDGLYRGGEHVGEVATQQTPIREGTLVRGQKVHPTEQTGPDSWEVSITYPGPYARYQHEKLSLRHEHGNAKFLELPLHSEADTAMAITARRIKDAL